MVAAPAQLAVASQGARTAVLINFLKELARKAVSNTPSVWRRFERARLYSLVKNSLPQRKSA
jgi:hypothetical protein